MAESPTHQPTHQPTSVPTFEASGDPEVDVATFAVLLAAIILFCVALLIINRYESYKHKQEKNEDLEVELHGSTATDPRKALPAGNRSGTIEEKDKLNPRHTTPTAPS